MAYIKVDINKLNNLQADLRDAVSGIDSAKDKVQSVRRNLDWDVASENRIDRNLQNLVNDLDESYRSFNEMVRFLDYAVQQYSAVEEKNSKTVSASISSQNSNVTSIGASVDVKTMFLNWLKQKGRTYSNAEINAALERIARLQSNSIAYGIYSTNINVNLMNQMQNLHNNSEQTSHGSSISTNLQKDIEDFQRMIIMSNRSNIIPPISLPASTLFIDNITNILGNQKESVLDIDIATILDTLLQSKEEAKTYQSLASFGTKDAGVSVLEHISWMEDSKDFDDYSAVSAHYNDMHLNLLHAIQEKSEDKHSLAASLVTMGVGNTALSLLGTEVSHSMGDIFGNASFGTYLAQVETENSDSYFGKSELNFSSGLKTSGKIKKTNDSINKYFESKDLRTDEKEDMYFDKDGNALSKNNSPTFYERSLTLAEIKTSKAASTSLYSGNFDIGQNGNLEITVGEAEAHANLSVGLYVVGPDGKEKFSPGAKIEVGTSITAFEADWDHQWIGDENFGLNSNVTVTAGKVEAKGDLGVQFYNEDGSIDPEFGGSVSLEAIGGEIKGDIGVNVLGGEVAVVGSLNYGIGAHADVGYKDGVFKCDIGASLGLGASVAFEVDVGGMVDTVIDGAIDIVSAIFD